MGKKQNIAFFLNETYRKLIEHGRTYASYTKDELNIIFNDLNTEFVDTIYDPMSGYGGLMHICKTQNINTINLEINEPAYYWQILNNPSNSQDFIKIIEAIFVNYRRLPKIKEIAIASNDYFSNEGLNLSYKLLSFIHKIAIGKNIVNYQDLSLAILLPFIFRLSTATNGDVTHIKKGGITVFTGWNKDFKLYLESILEHCILVNQNININKHHVNFLGDARSFTLQNKVNCVITSPPFPNYRDYHKMFAPENVFLDHVRGSKSTNKVIGSNIVKGKTSTAICSTIANKFLKDLLEYKGTKKAENDIKAYYHPYFRNYFSDIEIVIKNLINQLSQPCFCYFVVVNNATRNLTVPVSEVISELFEMNNFSTKYIYNSDVYHVGTKNPHAKGQKAKHTKYIIKAWK